MKIKSAKWLHIVGLILVAGYLTYINIFVIQLSPELIFIEFILLMVILNMAPVKFIKDWIIYIGLFFLYEWVRGLADNISPFYDNTLLWIHYAESWLFGGTVPTISLQHWFLRDNLFLYICLVFYSSYFYYSFVIGLVIWIFRRSDFHQYFRRFLAMSFLSVVFFYLVPTAPPWFVSPILNLDINRELFINTFVTNFKNGSLVAHYINANLVAAFPSLHVGWTAYTTLFLLKKYSNKWLWLLLIVPLMISLSVVLTGEHYVLDIVAGWLLALAFTIKIKKNQGDSTHILTKSIK